VIKYTFITSSPQTIENGESIIVDKIVISSNFTPTVITLYERDGITEIVTLRVTAGVGQNFEMTTGFIAPQGVVVSGNLINVCTIFYSQGAA